MRPAISTRTLSSRYNAFPKTEFFVCACTCVSFVPVFCPPLHTAQRGDSSKTHETNSVNFMCRISWCTRVLFFVKRKKYQLLSELPPRSRWTPLLPHPSRLRLGAGGEAQVPRLAHELVGEAVRVLDQAESVTKHTTGPMCLDGFTGVALMALMATDLSGLCCFFPNTVPHYGRSRVVSGY